MRRDIPRLLLAVTLGVALFFAVNAFGGWWLRATVFASDAFYDGCAAILTLALPAFIGGLAIGFLTGARGVAVSLAVFAGVGAISLMHPLWRVPLVSPHSVHSGAMHYFLHNPIVALTFGAAGAWLAAQFVLGRFRLADAQPITPQQMGD